MILVGVDDDGTIVGYGAAKAVDQLHQIVRDNVVKAITVTVETVRVRGRPVHVVRVPRGDPDLKPYRVGERAIVRAGATNRTATTVELRRLATQSITPEPPATIR